jgi:hypothetical protein
MFTFQNVYTNNVYKSGETMKPQIKKTVSTRISAKQRKALLGKYKTVSRALYTLVVAEVGDI